MSEGCLTNIFTKHVLNTAIFVRYLVVCGRSAHVPMSPRVRTSVLDMCKVENVMDSWAVRDSVENRSDSSGYDRSDCGAVSALIFPWLLYSPDSCCLSRVYVPSRRLLRFVGLHS